MYPEKSFTLFVTYHVFIRVCPSVHNENPLPMMHWDGQVRGPLLPAERIKLEGGSLIMVERTKQEEEVPCPWTPPASTIQFSPSRPLRRQGGTGMRRRPAGGHASCC